MKATIDTLRPGMRVERDGVIGVARDVPPGSALALVQWSDGRRGWVQIVSLTIRGKEAA